ncbi:hypothetical protein AMELA_G00065230 [Ameiurus melas]|uniref:Uncharacterized protein n=1 Tax=Ameiurus melas TaxID=219545 RepID=A0A7J6B369_AMEME|nr:hypothetical protein AMELA_G00065230 [Ameiurus melas]
MAEEGEMENIVPSDLNTRSETGALVEVKFQKNPYQTQKYLEAEPKALGVTQIMLSLFFLSILGATLRNQQPLTAIIRAFISSVAISDHISAIEMLVQATQIALSATLAAFCCKVIQCCSSRSNVTSCNSTGETNMEEEGEMENIVPSDLNTMSETGALVEVKFQKNPYQTQKYLEAEPKALGVTQIMLSVFIISLICSTSITDHFQASIIIDPIGSLLCIIAGSVAIAAQSLHLPTLKACLGMQIVACVASVFSFMTHYALMWDYYVLNTCWEVYTSGKSTRDMCVRLWSIYEHVTGIQMLVQATQIALSATLAAFCCKVIQCCSPRSNVPVIGVNAPPGPGGPQ